ncbi:hypothetical protein JL720_7324 [Aureococcus anophagefferens]|nr:hypothetical protein JL720_7324 [Aureococcus anophagefferens]
MGKLDGKVCIVTGASSGIGLAVATALAGEGAKVVMVSRSITQEKASAVKGDTVAVACDVVKRGDVKAMVDGVVDAHGAVDVVVNCAGVMYFTLMKNLKYDQWEQTIDVNCKGTAGHFVNISSDAAKTLFGALTVYNAAKAFVSVFSKGLRAECVGTGLRVTDVQPGDTATNLIQRNDDAEAAEKMGVTVGAVVGGGDVGPACLAPSDVADAVLYAVPRRPTSASTASSSPGPDFRRPDVHERVS